MQTQLMEISIGKALFEDEQLLWSGMSNPKNAEKNPSLRFSLFSGLAFCLFGLLAFLATSAYNIAFFSQENFNPYLGPLTLGGIFFILGILLICMGLIIYFSPHCTSYAITDRRIIILRKGRDMQMTSYNKRAISHIHCIERPDASGDLNFFSIINNKSSCLGTFAAISHVRQVEHLFIGMFDEDQSGRL